MFFGASPAGPSFPTFDNAAGLNNAAISQLSVAGVNGAFVAANDANEIGSPGTIVNPIVIPSVVISEVTPWSSGNTPYAADWFEVTNTGAVPVDITGWKMDDSSNAFATAVALRGVTSIPAGKSADLPRGRRGWLHRRDAHRQLLDGVVRIRDPSRRLPHRGLRWFAASG